MESKNIEKQKLIRGQKLKLEGGQEVVFQGVFRAAKHLPPRSYVKYSDNVLRELKQTQRFCVVEE